MDREFVGFIGWLTVFVIAIPFFVITLVWAVLEYAEFLGVGRNG